jgi:hypothetical protein
MAGTPAQVQEADFSEELLQIPDLQPLAAPLAEQERYEPSREVAKKVASEPTVSSAAAPLGSAEPVVEKFQHGAEPSAQAGAGEPAPKKVADSQPPALPAVVPPTAPLPEQKPFGFRPTIPKVQARLEPDSPEAELADQMKPVGPTPPPIRFRWNEQSN